MTTPTWTRGVEWITCCFNTPEGARARLATTSMIGCARPGIANTWQSSARTVDDPPGKHSPLTAGRSTTVQLYCSSCVIGTTGCSPCPNGGTCIGTPVATHPVTGTATSPSTDTMACVCSTSAATSSPCSETVVAVVSCPSENDQTRDTERFLIVLILCCALALLSCVISSTIHRRRATQSNNLILQGALILQFHFLHPNGWLRSFFRWIQECTVGVVEEENEITRVQLMNDHLCEKVEQREGSTQPSQVETYEKEILKMGRMLNHAHLESVRVKSPVLNQGFGFKGIS
eukprot:TRINITY_DN16830_c0_g1_i3.p1 TRINITY_DN16830_c0_g1~~TRINITY_DN16830_c0_g1_i3.p1  ORF type:complete len:289 (+),score=28.02 TRINITY_DN16830_c0_g1_i3:258-1124(+)